MWFGRISIGGCIPGHAVLCFAFTSSCAVEIKNLKRTLPVNSFLALPSKRTPPDLSTKKSHCFQKKCKRMTHNIPTSPYQIKRKPEHPIHLDRIRFCNRPQAPVLQGLRKTTMNDPQGPRHAPHGSFSALAVKKLRILLPNYLVVSRPTKTGQAGEIKFYPVISRRYKKTNGNGFHQGMQVALKTTAARKRMPKTR